jgi:hypothetical protein
MQFWVNIFSNPMFPTFQLQRKCKYDKEEAVNALSEIMFEQMPPLCINYVAQIIEWADKKLTCYNLFYFRRNKCTILHNNLAFETLHQILKCSLMCNVYEHGHVYTQLCDQPFKTTMTAIPLSASWCFTNTMSS